MSLTWQPWTPVSEGSSTPGAPVAAVPWEDSFALFISDPSGGVYAIKATPGFGWEAVPGRNNKPGAPITALLSGTRFHLFMADVTGEIFTTSGIPYQGWQPWTAVSEGSSTPGATVAGIPWGDSFALFISDPGGGVYAIKATPGFGWEQVPGRNSKPGSPITALFQAGRFHLFMADSHGEIFTTSGIPYQGWQPWTSVSEGSSTPGAPVAALPWEDSFALFISDPNGGVYAIKATPGFGWQAVPGRSSKPGAQVTVFPWYKPPASSGFAQSQIVLMMVDVNGQVAFTSGRPYQSWDAWTTISGISAVPGAPVTALPKISGSSPFSIFVADSHGEIFGTKTSAPPATPQLSVTNVTSQAIDVSWSESNPAVVEVDGFELFLTHNNGTQERTLNSTERAFSWTGLQSGVQYTLKMNAFNSNGYSPSSTVQATTPVVGSPPFLAASVTALIPGNYVLVINGSNFGKGEQVVITVDWTVGSDSPQRFPVSTETADIHLGAFQTTFAGNVPTGLCPISEPFGTPQPFPNL